jgi:hypothetical protein
MSEEGQVRAKYVEAFTHPNCVFQVPAADLVTLLSALDQVREERDAEATKYESSARQLLKDICSEAMGKECDETCDSYGHDETCRAYSVLNEARARTQQLAALTAELDAEAEQRHSIQLAANALALERDTLSRQRDRLVKALGRIHALSAGWDDDGSLGPKSPLSWESVGRMALDYARAALQPGGGA